MEQNTNKLQLPKHIVSTRRFWKIEYECWTGGYDGGDYTGISIYWGTWFEAARECIKNDQSVGRHTWRRKVEAFELPDIKRKRKPFYVCYEYTCPFCGANISVGGGASIGMVDLEHDIKDCTYLIAMDLNTNMD